MNETQTCRSKRAGSRVRAKVRARVSCRSKRAGSRLCIGMEHEVDNVEYLCYYLLEVIDSHSRMPSRNNL